MADEAPRERSVLVTWQDPLPAARRGLAMSGLDYLRAIWSGELSAAPIARLIGFEFTEIAEGRVAITLAPGERHYNPLGTVHGGIAATMLDTTMGCAVHSTLPRGRGYTTLEIKINYLRAMTEQTGPVRAEATVVHAGRQTAMAEGRIVDGAGRVYAAGTTTCLLFDIPLDAAPGP
jgi:uncharacterized protein (TIGR00369 family)